MFTYQKQMSWEYIAAFFDGEGCLSVLPQNPSRGEGKTSHTIRVAIFQSEKSAAVLDEMVMFLRRHDVRANRYNEHLHVQHLPSVKVMLEKMMPFLRVKREFAIECHQYIKEVNQLHVRHGRNWFSKGFRPAFVPVPASLRG